MTRGRVQAVISQCLVIPSTYTLQSSLSSLGLCTPTWFHCSRGLRGASTPHVDDGSPQGNLKLSGMAFCGTLCLEV